MLNILIIVAAFLIAVVLARIIIPRILIISLRKRLFDTPDARKVHKRPVSRLGGVSFFPAILFTVTFLIGICYMTGWVSLVDTGQHWVQILFMCTGLTLLYIVGITDDLIGVRYRQKFLVQLIAASMFPLAGLYINDFYGLFGIHAVSPFIGVPLTLVLVIFITNAINLIDGIDGLASGLSMVALSVFGTLAVIDDRWMSALLAFTTVGVLLPFFFYNVFGNADRGRKIFMGDTGSLTIGGIIAVFAIIIHKELLIPILCGVFLVENLSVILQRAYYKAGKRKGVKQRLFKRTPIHDHFRTSMSLIEPGCTVKFTKPDQLFHESKITVRFWIVTIVLAAITIITLKIR